MTAGDERPRVHGRAPVTTPGRASGRLRQLLVLVALAVAGVVAGRLTVLLLDHPSPAVREAAPVHASDTRPTDPLPRAGAAARAAGAAALLHRWDAARATAYARGDPSALRRLYVPGSRAGARDVRLLEAYAARGLVVRGLRTQLLSLRVLSRGSDRLRIEVTDRRVGGRAVGRVGGSSDEGGAVAVALPQDAPSTRVLELRHREGRWRVSSVVDG